MTKVRYSPFRILIILVIGLTIQSCVQKHEAPSELIPKAKMSNILADVHIAEASLQMVNVGDRDSIARLYYGHIFRIHKIDEDLYYKSLEHYSMSPADLQEIYEASENMLRGQKVGEGAKK